MTYIVILYVAVTSIFIEDIRLNVEVTSFFCIPIIFLPVFLN